MALSISSHGCCCLHSSTLVSLQHAITEAMKYINKRIGILLRLRKKIGRKDLINAWVFRQPRPTQAYYVPRKLSEYRRESHTVADNRLFSKQTDNAIDQEPEGNLIRNRSIPETGHLLPKKPLDKTEVKLPRSEQTWKFNNNKNASNEQQTSQGLAGLKVAAIPRVVAEQSRLMRPNNFCPVSTQHTCICDRPNAHVICKRCGLECVGRVQLVCSVHPKKMALMDMNQCPNTSCRSIQILETPIYPKDSIH